MSVETTLKSPIPTQDHLSVVTRALEQKQSLLIRLGNGCDIFLNGTRRSFFTQDNEHLKATGNDYRHLSFIPGQSPPAHLNREHPISELQWIVAYYQSNGSLLGQCRRDDVIKLIRWPNFTRLPHELADQRIAALFTRRATSLVLASRVLKTDEPELNRFYSAANAAGYTRIINRVAPPVIERQEHKHQSIIGKLITRFLKK